MCQQQTQLLAADVRSIGWIVERGRLFGWSRQPLAVNQSPPPANRALTLERHAVIERRGIPTLVLPRGSSLEAKIKRNCRLVNWRKSMREWSAVVRDLPKEDVDN